MKTYSNSRFYRIYSADNTRIHDYKDSAELWYPLDLGDYESDRSNAVTLMQQERDDNLIVHFSLDKFFINEKSKGYCFGEIKKVERENSSSDEPVHLWTKTKSKYLIFKYDSFDNTGYDFRFYDNRDDALNAYLKEIAKNLD